MTQPVVAQDEHQAPSLQVGLSGMNFTRGTLDAELIAEIIVEKQKEVKNKLIKNLLLNNIGVDNGLFYAYIDNTIDIITTERDENTRVKNLIENTVNLSFVLAYAEYYLYTLKPGSEELNNLRTLAFSYGIDTTLIRPKISLKDIAQIRYAKTSATSAAYESKDSEQVRTARARRNQFIGVLLDVFAEVVRTNEDLKQLGLMRTNYFQNSSAINAYLNLEFNEEDTLDQPKQLKVAHQKLRQLYFSKNKYKAERDSILALREAMMNYFDTSRNVSLTSLQALDNDFFNKRIIPYRDSLHKAYREFQKVLESDASIPPNLRISYLMNENYRQQEFKAGGHDALIKSVIGISPTAVSQSNGVVKKLFSPVQWYYDYLYKLRLYEEIYDKKRQADKIFLNVQRNLSIHLKYAGLIKSLSTHGNNFDQVLKTLSDNFECGDLKRRGQDIHNLFTSARREIDSIRVLTDREASALVSLNSFSEKLRFIDLNRYESIGIFEKEIKPSLDLLAKYSTDFLAMRDSISNQLFCITSEVKTELDQVNIQLNPAFIKLIARLNEFDKIETYDLYLNLLSEAGDVFSDEKMRASINRVISFLRSYIKISRNDSEEITLNIDTEGFIMALQKIQYPKWRPVQFHFTVGLNNMALRRSLVMGEDTIRNFSSVSEKIGVKIKLYDWKYTRSFDRGEPFTYWGVKYKRLSPPREPTFSNVHILVYGSGLLYNILDTGTNKNFNAPLVGAGLGFTFFNNLDFNFSWGRPILSNRSFLSEQVPSYFNVGFDIQFLEYFQRLGEKRQARKIQKKLAEAKT